MKYSLASEGRESHKGFCYLVHLAEVILQEKILVKSFPGLKGKHYADSLKSLKLSKKKENLYMLALSNVDKLIFSSDNSTSKKLVKGA